MNDQEWRALRRRVRMVTWSKRLILGMLPALIITALAETVTGHWFLGLVFLAVAYVGWLIYRWEPILIRIDDEEEL